MGDIRDVRLALEGAFETAPPQAAGAATEGPAEAGHYGRRDRRRVALFTTAGLVVGAAVAASTVWLATRPSPPSVVRTTVTTSGSTALT